MRKLSTSLYLPLTMSISKFFNNFSSRPTLAGVPVGQPLLGHVRPGTASGPTASTRVSGSCKVIPTTATHKAVFFMTYLRGGLDEPRCALALALDEARELGLRHVHRIRPVFGEPRTHVRSGEGACDVLRKCVH